MLSLSGHPSAAACTCQKGASNAFVFTNNDTADESHDEGSSARGREPDPPAPSLVGSKDPHCDSHTSTPVNNSGTTDSVSFFSVRSVTSTFCGRAFPDQPPDSATSDQVAHLSAGSEINPSTPKRRKVNCEPLFSIGSSPVEDESHDKGPSACGPEPVTSFPSSSGTDIPHRDSCANPSPEDFLAKRRRLAAKLVCSIHNGPLCPAGVSPGAFALNMPCAGASRDGAAVSGLALNLLESFSDKRRRLSARLSCRIFHPSRPPDAPHTLP